MVANLERAIELDANYVQAQAGLAHAYALDHLSRWSNDLDASLGRANQLTKKVMARAPNDAYSFNVAVIVAGFERNISK